MALILSGDTGPSFVQSAAMPTGSILQVVQGTTSTAATSTNGTYIDTNLTATITPKFATSKILIHISQTDVNRGNSGWSTNTSMGFKLVRNGSDVISFNPNAMYMSSSSVGNDINLSGQYLDSPATTSALTYKTQFCLAGNSGTVGVQWNGASTSSIVLMEIAA
jgi:hypothetical protein